MDGGYIKLWRGWRDSPALDTAEKRDAWVWLIENACWKPKCVKIKGSIVALQRGELSFSVRFLAESWGWSKSKVDRFMADLRAETMIETRSKSGTSAGHSAGQGQSIISICNYAKYQDKQEGERDNDSTESGTSAGQQRDKEEESKKEKKEGSVAKATGASAVDQVKVIFDTGVRLLTAVDMTPNHARSLIGKWRKDYSDSAVLAVLARAEVERPMVPEEWIAQALKWENGNGRQQSTRGGSTAAAAERARLLLGGGNPP